MRAALPSLADGAYLNTGGAGPLAQVAARAIAADAERSLGRGRMGLAAIGDGERTMASLRIEVAKLLGSEAERVAITQNTTHGINVVVWGLDWSPGDEVITTALEHPGVAAPLFVLARRRGVRLRVIPLDEAHGDLEAAVSRRAGPRTRLVALSHVAYGTGALLDVTGAGSAASAAGALSLVDGAQSAGAIPVAPYGLGVDAYALPAQKWLLGPEGLGALWISDEATERVDMTFAAYESGGGHSLGGAFEPHPGARRYELSTPPLDLVGGWLASLRWLGEVGWEHVHARTLQMARAARERLEEEPRVRVVTPPGEHAGLISFALDGHDPMAASAALSRRGVTVRPIDHPPCLRLSAGFFTDDADLKRLLDEIRALVG